MRRLLSALLVAGTLAGCATIEADGQFNQAVTSFKAGAYADAERWANAADRATPNTDKVEALVAWSRLMQGNVAGAEQALAKLKARSPDYIETIQVEGWVALAHYRYDVAAERFQAQLDWCARHRRSSYYPARYSTKDQTFIEATFADANHGLGLVALARQQPAAAIGHLRTAASINQYGAQKDVRALLASLGTR